MPPRSKRSKSRRISQVFRLGKSQAELDFVDVPVDADVRLFIDPFAMSQRQDPWSQDAHATLLALFQQVVEAIRDGRTQDALDLLRHFGEPNETRLGYSTGRPRGSGLGVEKARVLHKALSESTAVKTGFLTSLQDCELMVAGISRDGISDMTTAAIRAHLVRYTQAQAKLHGIPMHEVPLPACYWPEEKCWRADYHDLPVAAGRPILLVPKAIVRQAPAFNHQRYYNYFAIPFLQAEHLAARSSLVRALKNGRQRVYKKNVKAEFKCTKENLFQFSREHPEVLEAYRASLAALEKRGPDALLTREDESLIAASLTTALLSVPPGDSSATKYHRLMVGIVEFLFFPDLMNPILEKEIHDGRKRIDIVMENGAYEGPLVSLHMTKKVACAYVPMECKNYGHDVSNPELDQLSGRFAVNKARQFGILLCRRFQNRARFIKRCQDTFSDGRGLIIPMDDERVLQLLEAIGQDQRFRVREALAQWIGEIMVS